jgi:P27 family predicted phage terminase small subunit
METPALKLRRDASESEEVIPTCPAILTGEGRREWHRIVAALARLGTLETVDRSVLTVYCQAWADFHEASRMLAEADVVCGYIAVQNQWHPHPATKLKEQATAALLKYATLIGIGATARSKLKITKRPKAAPAIRSRSTG